MLVIKHGAFGDIVQSEGALHDIRLHHPGVPLVALTTPPYRKLLERCPWIDEVMVDPRAPRWRWDRMLVLRHLLRRLDPSCVYDLQNSTRTSSYRRWMLPDRTWFGPVRRRDWRGRARQQTEPALVRMAHLLDDAKVPVRHTPKPDLGWMATDMSAELDRAGLAGRRFVMLMAGSSANHSAKRWPYYRALASALLDRGIAVVSTPGPDEPELRSMPGTVLTGPCGFLDWFEMAGVIGRAAFVVGNDTGPTHLAAHSGARGVALFGSHMPARLTGVETDRFGVIEVPDLAALPLERVLAATLSALGEEPSAANGTRQSAPA